MNQTKKLLQTLKKILKSKGITYLMLAKELKLSEPTIKRCFSDDEVLTMKRFESILKIAGVSFLELTRLSDLNYEDKPNELTLEQEEILSQDINLFKIFYLLLRQWDLKKIETNFKIPKMTLEKILIQLDRLKLIEFHAEGKFKLLTRKNIKWRKNGPIYNIFEAEMKSHFLERDFKNNNEKFILLTGNLTLNSQLMLKERLTQFEKEVEDLIEMDSHIEKTATDSTAIMLAMGPIALSIFRGGQ